MRPVRANGGIDKAGTGQVILGAEGGNETVQSMGDCSICSEPGINVMGLEKEGG